MLASNCFISKNYAKQSAIIHSTNRSTLPDKIRTDKNRNCALSALSRCLLNTHTHTLLHAHLLHSLSLSVSHEMPANNFSAWTWNADAGRERERSLREPSWARALSQQQRRKLRMYGWADDAAADDSAVRSCPCVCVYVLCLQNKDQKEKETSQKHAKHSHTHTHIHTHRQLGTFCEWTNSRTPTQPHSLTPIRAQRARVCAWIVGRENKRNAKTRLRDSYKNYNNNNSSPLVGVAMQIVRRLCMCVCVCVWNVAWLVWNNYNNNNLLKWDKTTRQRDNIDEAANKWNQNGVGNATWPRSLCWCCCCCSVTVAVVGEGGRNWRCQFALCRRLRLSVWLSNQSTNTRFGALASCADLLLMKLSPTLPWYTLRPFQNGYTNIV